MSIEYIGKKRLDWQTMQDHGMPRREYKAMKSKDDGFCVQCGQEIEKGASIWYRLKDRTAIHEACRPRQGV